MQKKQNNKKADIEIINYLEELEEKYILQKFKLEQRQKELIAQSISYETAKKSLEDLEENYQLFVENLPVGVYRADPGVDGRILMGNPALVKMFGFHKEKEAIGLKVTDFYQNPHQREDFSRKLLTNGKVIDYHLPLKRRNGEPFWISVTSRITHGRDGRVYFDGVVDDITEKKQIAENLKSSYNKLQSIDKLKSDFIAIASHELRSPLTVIKGYASMILEDCDNEISEQVKFQVKNIYQSSQRLIEMTEKMLDIERIELGELKSINEFSFNLLDAIQLIMDDFNSLCRQKKLKINLSKPKTKLPKIAISKDELSLIINNLLSNAIKFSGINGKICISFCENKNFLKISISDNGKGVSPEFHDLIFEKFCLGTDEINKKTDGLGLGLSLCKEILQKRNGKISLCKKKKRGAKFIIEIPKIL